MQLIPKHATLDDKIQHGLIWLLRVLALGALAYAVIGGNYEQLINGSFAIFLLFVPDIIQRRYDIKLPVEFSFLIVLFMYGSGVLGEMQGFYDRYFWWDSMLHISSGVMLGFAGFLMLYTLYHRKKLQTSPFWISFFAFCFALALGAVWEIFEFTMDQIFNTKMQPSGVDTMWDLIFDGGAALISVIVGYRFMKRKGKPDIFEHAIKSFLDHNPNLRGQSTKLRP